MDQNDINLDDYVVPEEELSFKRHLDLMNIFLVYFKTLFKREPNLNMFDGVDEDQKDFTNRHMELFYEELLKYKENINDEQKITIYQLEDIDINSCDELYILKYNDKEYGCQFLIPLMSLLSDFNWRGEDWSIIPIKNINN